MLLNKLPSSSTISASNGDTFKNLVAVANKWRRGIIQALFNASVVKNVSGTTVAASSEIEDLDTLSADFLTVGTNPTEKAFSNHDVLHFGNELADERDINTAKLADVMNVIRVARGRVNPLFLKDKTHFTCTIAKCNAVLAFLGEEMDRRESEAKSAAAALAAQKAAQREKDKLEHEAFIQAMRDKYRARGPRVPNHKPHADESLGKGLEALAVLNRRAGKFITEQVMTRGEALKVAEDLSSLPLVFPDRKVLDVKLNKAGKVYRYVLKS